MSGEKILIVDDERAIADLLKLHLEEEGYVTVSTQSVDKALKALDQGSFDLVMLDIRMPGKDGFDFLRAVSTKHGKPSVPVIVMTGRGELERLMEGIAVDGFVNKPFEMHVVLGTIKKVLSSKRKTVYVVDVEGSVGAQGIVKELQSERYQVFFIHGVEGFRGHWAKQPADYIVMEYEQHTLAGDEMIREIRKSAVVIPLIVYTYSGMDFREKSLKAGASVYLGSPRDPAAVVTAIRQFEMA